MVFNLILAIPFSYVGLAMATALSGTMNAYLLYRRLAKDEVYKIGRDTWYFILKVVIASVVMLACIVLFSMRVPWIELNLSGRISNLAYTVVIGLASYFVSMLALGIRPHQLLSKE
jgi:putative peptidoglycan lipid II flippase